MQFALSLIVELISYGLGNFAGVLTPPTPLNTPVSMTEDEMSGSNGEPQDNTAPSVKPRRPSGKNTPHGIVEGPRRGNIALSK